eukprot:766782-Hanusia_phi.AAC.5
MLAGLLQRAHPLAVPSPSAPASSSSSTFPSPIPCLFPPLREPESWTGRLTPPPRPCYTLHRKLSGAFLSSIKLGARISCREMFYEYFSRLEKRVLDNRNNYN